ncbi:MAG: glycosyltransferase [Cytophagaceae bacterium]|jgi:glycosyltransferase involved in cell wall biosynthesis|nr:glycosyltransferase [Cytophagaceae bacterium]
MKVGYYFRSSRKGVFSIEVLFKRVMTSLSEHITAYAYHTNPTHVIFTWIKSFIQPLDVYHITGDINFVALGLNGSKTILTIHDIGHYTYSLKGWKKYISKKVWFDWPLRKVAFVTTVSEFTKQQLMAEFSIHTDKVKVVHNAFPSSYKRDDKLMLSPVPKILQIGGGDHKNLSRLVEAIKDMSCELLLVRAYDQQLDDSLKQQGILATWFFDLTDEEIYEVYKKSDLVFFASTYEGFGLPILEAQAIGRAVITSNCASMPEVAGLGAVLVDPYQVSEIRGALVQLINDDVYRTQRIKAGYENLERFKPDVIAQQYLTLYNQVLHGIGY